MLKATPVGLAGAAGRCEPGDTGALRCFGEAAAVLDAPDFSAERPRAKPGRRLSLFRRTGQRHRLGAVLPGPVRACLPVLIGTLLPAVEARAQDLAADRAALAALYNATGGGNWTNNTNWLSEEPLSEWYGVTVSGDAPVLLARALGECASLNQINSGLRQSLAGSGTRCENILPC